MNKALLFFCSIYLFSISCQSQSSQSYQSINQDTIIDEEQLLLGEIDKKALQQVEYQSWFDSVYMAYQPNDSVLNAIEPLLKNIRIKVFMGTWCSDSQRDVPALYKIIDQLDFDKDKFEIIAIDRSKTLPKAELEGYTIEYVPTTILYRKDTELGRIIEYPEKTMEEDIYRLLTK